MKKKRNKPASHPLPSMPVHSEKNQSLSSTSTSTSTFSSFSSTPSPSPSPYHIASFSVPFAWERKPGVPYTPLHPHHLTPTSRNFPSNSRPLPLPPSKVYSLVDNNGNLTTIRRQRRRGLEFFLALISRLTGLDPYCSRKSVAVDEMPNYEVPNTAVRASRRRHKR